MKTTRVRSLSRVLTVLVLLLIPAATLAATKKTLVRLEAGGKVQQTCFYVNPGALDFKLTVQNGATRGKDRVSSAVVSLNGIAILRQRDFNQNVASIEKEIDARLIDNGKNVLEIEINGKPTALLTAQITATYPEPRVRISWYWDKDLDGYGCVAPMMRLPEGVLPPSPPPPMPQWVTNHDDCDDRNPNRYPGHNCPPVL